MTHRREATVRELRRGKEGKVSTRGKGARNRSTQTKLGTQTNERVRERVNYRPQY